MNDKNNIPLVYKLSESESDEVVKKTTPIISQELINSYAVEFLSLIMINYYL